jgi:hypothetical protein
VHYLKGWSLSTSLFSLLLSVHLAMKKFANRDFRAGGRSLTRPLRDARRFSPLRDGTPY